MAQVGKQQEIAPGPELLLPCQLLRFSEHLLGIDSECQASPFSQEEAEPV